MKKILLEHSRIYEYDSTEENRNNRRVIRNFPKAEVIVQPEGFGRQGDRCYFFPKYMYKLLAFPGGSWHTDYVILLTISTLPPDDKFFLRIRNLRPFPETFNYSFIPFELH